MKCEQRNIYRVLADEIDHVLCSFCRFDRCEYCGDSECVHPLRDRLSFPVNDVSLEPGDDCWAFRPLWDVALTADIVGIVLAKGWQVWVLDRKEDGTLLVKGAKDWW